MKRLLIALGVVLVGCGGMAAWNVPLQPVNEVERIRAVYRSWNALFETPRNISMELMLLCRTLTAQEEIYMASPHAEYRTQVYVNPQGAAAMRETGARVFPTGTVIVKEKFVLDNANAGNQQELQGLGVMVKRDAGFDAEGHDWEYFYVDKRGIETTHASEVENCRACHMGAADGVFFGGGRE